MTECRTKLLLQFDCFGKNDLKFWNGKKYYCHGQPSIQHRGWPVPDHSKTLATTDQLWKLQQPWGVSVSPHPGLECLTRTWVQTSLTWSHLPGSRPAAGAGQTTLHASLTSHRCRGHFQCVQGVESNHVDKSGEIRVMRQAIKSEILFLYEIKISQDTSSNDNNIKITEDNEKGNSPG